jgi:Uma2 family endonuclease
MQLPKEDERYSWNDYLAWPEGERFELIDGIAYAMSPAPRRRHQEINGEIFRQVPNALRGKPCRVYDAPFDVKLDADEDDDAPTVVQPDITVTCDRRRKFELYERFGVSEYWIVDQDERVLEVWRLEDDRTYRRSGVFGPDDTFIKKGEFRREEPLDPDTPFPICLSPG